MEQTMSLSTKVAWITGGGSGIGLAGAIELAKAGCRVVISGRDEHKLDAALAQAEVRGAPTGSRARSSRHLGTSTSSSTAPASTSPSARGAKPTRRPSRRSSPST
jgi:NAD(P)-dependent dehydrogenase (short-subunit alcohol dehydrogenase family)